MNTLLNSIALLALMAGAALAQEQADLDAFGIADDGAPLDDLAPDDGGSAPGLAKPEGAVAPETAAPAGPDAAAGAGPEIAGFEAPPDWQELTFEGYSFRHPGDWQLMQEGSDGVMLFNGDMQTQEGAIFGLTLDRESNIMPPDAVVLSETRVTVAGQAFRRLELTAMMDPTHPAELILLVSDQPVDGVDYMLVTGVAIGHPLDDYRPAIEQMMATLRYTPPQPPQETALDGLVVFAVPEGWQTLQKEAGVTLYPALYSGSITILKGVAFDGPGGFLGDVPPEAERGTGSALGSSASTFTWQGTEAEYVDGNQMVPGRYTLYQLDQCAPDGEALAVILAGVPETVDSAAFAQAVDGVALAEGVQLGACAARGTAAVAVPPAPAAGAGALALQVEVGGVTYRLPEGWQASYDAADDKMWASPDGRFSVLSFWWFPDEPLMGYSDVQSVENVIVDHEPVTRLFNSGNGMASIQNVTERARGDGKRFIFTLETTGASQDELKALHDLLVPTLRYGAGFDPAKPVEFAAP